MKLLVFLLAILLLLGVGNALTIYQQNITFEHNQSLVQTGSNGDRLGVIINVSNGIKLINASLDSATTSTQCYIYNSSGSHLTNVSVTVSGTKRYCVFNYPITANLTYFLESANEGGGAYTYRQLSTASVPTSYSGVTIVQGADTEVGVASHILNFISVAVERNITDFPITINGLSYTNPTLSTSNNIITINVTSNSSTNINQAYLYYNGTQYATSGTTDGINYIYSANKIPYVQTNTNYTFYFNFDTNVGSYNTENYNQTINPILIDNCSANTNQIINYTLYDEDTRIKLNNSAINVTSNVYIKLSGDLTGTEYQYYANATTANPLTICVSPALATGINYRLDAEVQYSSTDRVQEYHILENTIINTTAIPLTYNLYDLLTTNSEEYLITFKDLNYIAVSGAIIDIQRQYLSLGEYLSVERVRTDNDGRTIGHFVSGDELYRLLVYKNNNLIATYENVRVYCVSGTACTINLNQVGSTTKPSSFYNYLDLSYKGYYNSTLRRYIFDYSTTDGSSKTINVTISKFDNYGNSTLCSEQQTSFSGTLNCNIPSTYNGTAIVKIRLDGTIFATDSLVVLPAKDRNLNPIRFLIAGILILILPIMALGSGVMTLVMFGVGLVFATLFGLIDMGGIVGMSSVLVWFLIAIFILIWKASRGGQNG